MKLIRYVKDPLTYPSRRRQNSQVRIYEKLINSDSTRNSLPQ